MARKQELALEQQQLQAALDAGAASGIDPLDQPSIQPDIKVKQMVADATFSAVLGSPQQAVCAACLDNCPHTSTGLCQHPRVVVSGCLIAGGAVPAAAQPG